MSALTFTCLQLFFYFRSKFCLIRFMALCLRKFTMIPADTGSCLGLFPQEINFCMAWKFRLWEIYHAQFIMESAQSIRQGQSIVEHSLLQQIDLRVTYHLASFFRVSRIQKRKANILTRPFSPFFCTEVLLEILVR